MERARTPDLPSATQGLATLLQRNHMLGIKQMLAQAGSIILTRGVWCSPATYQLEEPLRVPGIRLEDLAHEEGVGSGPSVDDCLRGEGDQFVVEQFGFSHRKDRRDQHLAAGPVRNTKL